MSFPEANQVLGAPGCRDLPVQNDGTQMLSCWQLGWRARLSALLFGRVWLCIQGQVHPPVWIEVCRDPHLPRPSAKQASDVERP